MNSPEPVSAPPEPTTNTFLVDGLPIVFQPGQSILQAALEAGVNIPHLCHHPELKPHGSCKLCTVTLQGRNVSACTTPATPGLIVENNTPALNNDRRTLLQMLFVEGNHFCPGCEKSGACQLQAQACHLEMMSPHFRHFFPDRPVDASHPDVWLDMNRCILCECCVRASRDLDGKQVFMLAGRGSETRVVINSPTGRLGDSTLQIEDAAAHVCPVGAILPKRVGYRVPIGQRPFDLPPSAPMPPANAPLPANPRKLRIATASLAGCFGCHMSFLDLDEQLLELADHLEFDRSPITDIRHCGPCDIGLIEGGVCNTENIHVLRELRRHCTTLVALGACATNGGLPALRNSREATQCLRQVYRDARGETRIPDDPELPPLLDKVYPLHEIVHVDYTLPGCPPTRDALWKFLTDLLAGREPRIGPPLLQFD